MATFKLVLDNRVKSKNDKYNLSVRLINGNDVMILKYVQMTTEQYFRVFERKDMDKNSIEFRNKSNQFLSKCERIFVEMETFDKARYRDLVYDRIPKEVIKNTDPVLLTDLCTRFLEQKGDIKLKTRQLYQTAVNILDEYKPSVTYWDITSNFLVQFDKDKRDQYSPATISAYYRHLRGILNYFIYKEKIIPSSYQYPFGKDGLIIKKHQPIKFVMSNEEIKSVVEFNDFLSPEQEYARNIWLLLYRCNGINYADLFRMKWTNMKNDCLVFTRVKTEDTSKVAAKQIVAPLIPKNLELIELVGNKRSPYILGLLNDDYITEKDILYKKDWEERKLNASLKYISEKLNLSVDLQLSTARDCFATTLKRAGYAKDVIGEMMGHGNNYISTSHYLAHVDTGKLREISSALF